jgi:hypothetical protein
VQVLTNALPGGTIDMDNGNRINPPISMEPSDRGCQGGFGRSQRLLIFYWDVLWSGRLIPLRIQWQIPNKKV